MKMTRRETAWRNLLEQALWIEDHGLTLSGYVARYGSKNDPEHYGNGGEAIYAADADELMRRRAIWKRYE